MAKGDLAAEGRTSRSAAPRNRQAQRQIGHAHAGRIGGQHCAKSGRTRPAGNRADALGLVIAASPKARLSNGGACGQRVGYRRESAGVMPTTMALLALRSLREYWLMLWVTTRSGRGGRPTVPPGTCRSQAERPFSSGAPACNRPR
jgi:hypothetical protein